MKKNIKIKSSKSLTSGVYPFKIPIMLPEGQEWKPVHIFEGTTKDLLNITCRASALSAGYSPHTPHEHEEEELILLLSGSVDLILPEKLSQEKKCIHLEEGQFIYYPAYFLHTIKTTGKIPANYLKFKWHTVSRNDKSLLNFRCFHILNNKEDFIVKNGFYKYNVFEGPTRYLQKLHCHISMIPPGTGYEPHSDTYDVSIIVLEGEINTLGQLAKPYDVIFYEAGKPHGIYNHGSITARYIVFEFHTQNVILFTRIFNICSLFLKKVKDPKRWKKKLGQILGRRY